MGREAHASRQRTGSLREDNGPSEAPSPPHREGGRRSARTRAASTAVSGGGDLQCVQLRALQLPRLRPP